MEVETVKKLRVELAEEVQKLIGEFELRTGVYVDDVDLLRVKKVNHEPTNPGDLAFVRVDLIL